MPTTIESATLDLLDGKPTRHLIDGEWVASVSGETFPTHNPNTGAYLADIAAGDKRDIDLAVSAARRALDGPWKRFTPADRQDVLLRLADLVDARCDDLRLLDTIEVGGPIAFNTDDGRRALVNFLRYYAGCATNIHGETIETSVPGSFMTYTRKEPVGVVGGIIPWNGPLSQAIAKIAPVLATGCTIVLKPSEQAMLSPLLLGKLIQELDLPAGVVNIVTGDGPSAGAALTEHPDVDKIAFTGSRATGQAIIRASAGNLKRLTLELGGKSPDVVFADADLDAAVPGAGMGVFAFSGQMCVAGSRIYVQRPIYDEFVERLSAFAGALKVGSSLDPDTRIGPLVSERQLDRVTGYVSSGQAEGARPVIGGQRLVDGALADGYFIAPTVFVGVEDGMRIAQEEIFGPVAAVMPFETVDEVARRANSSDYGLAAGVWTHDVGTAHRMAAEIKAGVVWVNTYTKFDAAMPFGGYKTSGWGRERGIHSVDEFLNVKAVWIDTSA